MREELSIIVPVFNKAEMIKKTVESLLSQSYRPIQIILVDDGSYDGSDLICDEYALKFPEVVVVHQKNHGLIKARMKGVQKAKTEWVTFVDGDDWVEEDYYLKLMDPVNNETNIGASIGGYVYDYGRECKNVFSPKKSGRVRNVLLDMFNKEGFDWSACGKIYKKDSIESITEWWSDSPYGEDTELNWKYFSHEETAIYVSTYGYHYCIHEKSMMRNLTQEAIAYFDRLNRILDQIDRDPELFQAVNNVFLDISKYEKIEFEQIGSDHKSIEELNEMIEKAEVRRMIISESPDMSEMIDRELYRYKNEIDSFCRQYRNIYIYGTGHFGEIAFNYINSKFENLKGFIVSPGHLKEEKKCGKNVNEIGIDVIPDNSGVVVAVSDSTDVMRTLSDFGISNDDVYVWKCYEYYKPFPEIDYQAKGVKRDGPFFSGYHVLNAIGEEENTDKGSSFHNYLSKYDFFLEKLRNQNIKILELGVFNGASLRMWENYFESAEIIGVDIDEKCKENEDKRIKVLITDLGRESNLDLLKKMVGGSPKVIIDDASHFYTHQIKALIKLFPFLESGGIYIVEDLGTSFGENIGSRYDNSFISAYDFCTLISRKLAGCMEKSKNEKDFGYLSEQAEEIAKRLDMITFIQGSCIMVKG